MIIFWIIQKPYHVHITCWNVSGRKLPTAYTSQQLLRWLRPKRYIFPFFLSTKNTEKYVHIDTTHIACWHWISCPKLVSEMSEILHILVAQKSSFEVSKIVLFGHFRKSPEILKSYEILNFAKNRKNRKNPENLEKVDFLALWRVSYANRKNPVWQPKSRKSRLFRKSPIFWILCSDTIFCDFRKSKKSAKFSEFSTLKKSKKMVKLPWETSIATGGSFALSEVKKVPFFEVFRG